MSFTAIPQLQRAIVARLRGSSEVMALVTGVFDAVPQGQKFPYAVFDEPLETPNDHFDLRGHAVSVLLVIYTQDGQLTKDGRGRSGFTEGLTIAEAIGGQLTDLEDPVVVDDHALVELSIESVNCAREDDGVTRRCELTLTATLEDDGA